MRKFLESRWADALLAIVLVVFIGGALWLFGDDRDDEPEAKPPAGTSAPAEPSPSKPTPTPEPESQREEQAMAVKVLGMRCSDAFGREYRTPLQDGETYARVKVEYTNLLNKPMSLFVTADAFDGEKMYMSEPLFVDEYTSPVNPGQTGKATFHFIVEDGVVLDRVQLKTMDIPNGVGVGEIKVN